MIFDMIMGIVLILISMTFVGLMIFAAVKFHWAFWFFVVLTIRLLVVTIAKVFNP